MSVHKSLKFDSAAATSRSVLSRRERLERLTRDGKWDESSSVYGLPKVRTKFKVLGAKKKKAAVEEGAEGTAEVVSESASDKDKAAE
jgi:small basic protein (TIGR04137 family)